jgi:phosphoribosyl 1,2-cyclic phosphodiesterase
MSVMLLKFWGVRGSIPTPSPDTVLFGGNTSCLSVDFGKDVVIFNAGTGIRLLGQALIQRNPLPRIHLLLSHVHWDHIQGFPFFAPGFRSDCTIDIYGAGHADQTLGKILAGQMEGPRFPISLSQLGAHFTCKDIAPGDECELVGADGIPFARFSCAPGNHPNGVLAYRLQDLTSKRSLVYATDTEHFPKGIDKNLTQLSDGTDCLVYDGMYTPEEYEASHKGWGHSTWEKGLEIAVASQAKQMVVFHHDPSHSDVFLADLESEVQAHASQIDPKISVAFAREGMEIDFSAKGQ